MSLVSTNVFQVELKDDFYGYDRQGWRPVVSLSDALPGWRPVKLIKPIDDIGILMWASDAASGVWYLDAEDRYLASRLDDLAPPVRDQASTFMRRLAMERLAALIEGRAPDYPAQLESELRETLIQDWLSGGMAPSAFAPAVNATHLPYLASSLDALFNRLEIGPSGEVVMTIAHPRNGDRLTITHSLCLDDFRSVCPVPGEPGLFLCWGGHEASFVALYDAALGTVYVGRGAHDHWMAPHFFGRLEQDLYAHVVEHERDLAEYLRLPALRLAMVLRDPPHLGHQLYNELGGLDRLLAVSQGARSLPLVIVAGGPDSEVYGPTEELFPEWRGSVERWGPQWAARAYKARLCVMRLTVEHVSAALRSRIVARASRSSSTLDDRQRAEALKQAGSPVVLYGLRVENRTLVDQASFLIAFAQRLKATWPDATLVLDGHNVRSEGSAEVYASAQNCRRDPFDFEREIVAQVAEYCVGIGLPVIDLVGAVMERSVFWSAQATAFVAPWGAGLAKYRWLGNCPGVILSNRWNIAHRYDFQIYMDPKYMGEPSTVVVLDAAFVRDIDDTSSLIMSHPPDQPAAGSANFEVDVDEVIRALGRVMTPAGGT